MDEPVRISATEAARAFSDRLDEVEHDGRTFVIERHGREVALLAPIEDAAAGARTWADVLESLRDLPRPDDEFESEVEEIRRSIPPPRDPWASY